MERIRPLRAATAAAALIALWVSCRTAGPRQAVDAALTACVPPDTLALAGVNLEQLRASAIYQKLPPGAAAFLGPLRNASYLLLAYNGKGVLAIARGAFREAPPGAVLLAKDLAVSGSPKPFAPLRRSARPAGPGRPGFSIARPVPPARARSGRSLKGASRSRSDRK